MALDLLIADNDGAHITSSPPDFNGTLSVCFRVRIDAVTDGQNLVCLASSSPFNDLDYITYRNGGGGTGDGYLQLGRYDGGVGSFVNGSAGDIVVGTEYDIALVLVSATQAYCYIDGVQVLSNTTDVTGRAAMATFSFSEFPSSSNNGMTARAQGLKVFNIALNSTEVSAERGVCEPVAGSSYGWWPMQSGAADLSQDYGSGNHDLTFTGTPTSATNFSTLFMLRAPTQTAPSGATSSTVQVNWTRNSAYETNYEVQYRTTAGPGSWTTASAAISGTATNYTVTGLSSSTSYDFRSRALHTDGNSDWSGTQTASTTSGGASFPLAILRRSPAYLADEEVAAARRSLDFLLGQRAPAPFPHYLLRALRRYDEEAEVVQTRRGIEFLFNPVVVPPAFRVELLRQLRVLDPEPEHRTKPGLSEWFFSIPPPPPTAFGTFMADRRRNHDPDPETIFRPRLADWYPFPPPTDAAVVTVGSIAGITVAAGDEIRMEMSGPAANNVRVRVVIELRK